MRACSPSDCKSSFITFTAPNSDVAPTISIDSSVVGITTAKATITISTAKNFPVYGGRLVITLPTWYGVNGAYVFNAETSCTSAELEGVSSSTFSTSTSGKLSVIFGWYKGSGGTLTLQCTNYHNPSYKKTVEGFVIEV